MLIWGTAIFVLLTILFNVTGAFGRVRRYRAKQREWLNHPKVGNDNPEIEHV